MASDLDAAIRERLDDPKRYLENGVEPLINAILSLVNEHEKMHRLLGEPHEDHARDGLPLCQGWPYRPHADRICRHVHTIAEALGIAVNDA